jgi:hypothetical protein
MKSLTNRESFFASLPEMKALFGNLVTVKDKEGCHCPGIHQGFIASIIQFQPLLEIAVFTSDGTKVEFTLKEAISTPIEICKTFTSSLGLIMDQRFSVLGNQVFLHVEFSRDPDAGIRDFSVDFSGALLFSPQGVPYHWEDEKKVNAYIKSPQELHGIWKETSFVLRFSKTLKGLALHNINAEEIKREQYFSSHNLKKRYTYWVERPQRGGYDEASSLYSRNMGYAGAWIPDFADGEKASIDITFSVFSTNEVADSDSPKPIEEVTTLLNNEWEEYIKKIPNFRCSEKNLEKIYYTSWYILKSGRIHFPEKRFAYPFTSVNKFHYYNQFFWDSAFQAIAWLWFNDPDPSESEMKNFVAHQWRNGMIPYELFMYPVNGREWMDGDSLTSGTTQPPVIGITLKEVFTKFGNKTYLDFFYDSLVEYERWLSLYRDLGKRGLSSYVNIWETGWDNSPRFDAAARNRVLDPFIEGVDFNVYIYILRETILQIASVLDKPEPQGIREHQAMTKRSMNELMYNQEDHFYYDLEAATDHRIPVKTAAGLLPLMTDIPSAAQRSALIDRYLCSEKEFLTTAPVPSVSQSEESYSSYDFWRGANWPQITWSVLYGICEREPDEAGKVLDRFLHSTSANENCYEYYDSATGEGAGLPFQGWGALYTDFIIRFVVGIHPTKEGFRFNPISKEYKNFQLDNLILKERKLSIERKGQTWNIGIAGYGVITYVETRICDVDLSGVEIAISFAPQKADLSSISFSGASYWQEDTLFLKAEC